MACGSGDDEPQAVVAPKPPLHEVMVVFAPGQLGDLGYADNVMTGVNQLLSSTTDEGSSNDSLEVRFISPWNLSSMEEDINHWAETAESLFDNITYSRRLLVLTEPFMTSMLATVGYKLRPTDEVLLLKAGEEDVRQAAETYSLDGRLHGLNISAANSARRYCQYIEQFIRFNQLYNDSIVSRDNMAYYRLYDSSYSVYRDSVYETLQETFGSSTHFILKTLSDKQGEGIFSIEFQNSIIDAAYFLASLQQSMFEEIHAGFTIIDLGAGNAGWDYWLLSRNSADDVGFQTLVVDGQESLLHNRCCITRSFGDALADWCMAWKSSEAGSMPLSITHTGGDYCTDNIPDLSIMFND